MRDVPVKPLAGMVAVVMALLAGCNADPPKPASPPALRGDVAVNTAQAKMDTDRAFALIQRGEIAAAKSLLDRAVVADAMYGPAHNDLGLVYYQQDRPYDAAWEFERASKLMPKRGEPLNNLGLVYERADKWADAEAAYQSAYDLDPLNVEFAGNLARVRVRRGEQDETTHKLLQFVVFRDTRPAWVQWARANLYRTPAATAPTTSPTGPP